MPERRNSRKKKTIGVNTLGVKLGDKLGDKSIKEAEIVVTQDDTVVIKETDTEQKLPSKINSPVVWDEKVHYEKAEALHEDKMFKMQFDSIIVADCAIPVNIQLFLDDTSNGKYGVGNTRFVNLQPIQGEKSGKIHQSMVGVEWYMIGAKNGEVKMPDVGKMVVRGCTSFCFGNNVPPNNINPATGKVNDGETPKFNGILGGNSFKLEDMLDGLQNKGAFVVPIYNSFLTMSNMDSSLPDAPLKLCDVYLQMDKEKAVAVYKRFKGTKSHLFTGSKLPNINNMPMYAPVIQKLPAIMNQLFRERIQAGEYDLPANAPKDFLQLSAQQQDAILSKEPGKFYHCNMFDEVKWTRTEKIVCCIQGQT